MSIVAGVMLSAGQAAGEMQPLPERQREPGAALAAALGNLVYAPARFALTVINAAAGGITGLVTTNADNAAHDVFGITNGQGFLQPANVEGRESVRLGEARFGR